MKIVPRLAPLVFVTAVLAGCVDSPPAIPVPTCPTVPPKTPTVLSAPVPPVSTVPLTLQPAHWDWQDGGYVWTAAQWVPSPGPNPVWFDGAWSPNGGACQWIAGHFAPAAATP